MISVEQWKNLSKKLTEDKRRKTKNLEISRVAGASISASQLKLNELNSWNLCSNIRMSEF